MHPSGMRTDRFLTICQHALGRGTGVCLGGVVCPGGVSAQDRVATAQGKQGIWFLLFPDRENTGNFVLTQGKIC